MNRAALAACLALLLSDWASSQQGGGGPAPPAPPAPAPPTPAPPTPAPPTPAPPTPAPPTPAPPPPTPSTPPSRPGSPPREAPGAVNATGPISLPHMAPMLPVANLTSENAEQVADALEAFTDTQYVCPECHEADFEPGTCCGQERAASQAPPIASAAANPAAESISFIIAPGRRMRLSDFEKLLAPLHVDVQRDKLKITADVRLLVEGLPEDPEGTAALRAALTAPDLLEEFDVERCGTDRAALVVRHVAATPPTLTHLTEALAAARPPLHLADVVFSSREGPPPQPAAKSP